MSYIESTLTPNERVIYRTRLHWVIYFWPVLLIAIGIGLLLVPLAWLNRRTSEFGVTDRRLVVKTGLIRRQTMEVLLDKVEGVNVNQGIIGRMFGYGTLSVTGTGGVRQEFKRVARVMELRRQVYQQIEERAEASR